MVIFSKYNPYFSFCRENKKEVVMRNREQFFNKVRGLMVERLRKRGIKDERVLNAMRMIPRHRFMKVGYGKNPYDDHAQPIDCGQTISQPYIVALMTEAMELKGEEKVLEVGTGSGYQTAILAELANHVFSIEVIEKLAKDAEELLRELSYLNVKIKVDDGFWGWKEFSPYDAIIVTCGTKTIPKPLLEQLRVGGRMVVPLGIQSNQKLIKLWKKTSSILEMKELCSCSFVPMRRHLKRGEIP
jgi:protein-L-isoaspartate(D-aspartate) O-methyltransferase